MSKYTAKWLPVEGEIKEHDIVLKDMQRGTVIHVYSDGAFMLEFPDNTTASYPASRVKLAKLFLTSTDGIEVGDKARQYSKPDEEFTITSILESPPDGRLARGFPKGEMLVWNNPEPNVFQWRTLPEVFKVIGEISPDAYSYVKEGDVFTEEQIKCQMLNLKHKVETGALLSMEFAQSLVKSDPELFGIMIKVLGPCGRFH